VAVSELIFPASESPSTASQLLSPVSFSSSISSAFITWVRSSRYFISALFLATSSSYCLMSHSKPGDFALNSSSEASPMAFLILSSSSPILASFNALSIDSMSNLT